MWPYPKILAHRGGGTLAPENTLAAMRCGLAHGFRAVEFDVMLARDGVPVLMHDPEFGRTVPGHGQVSAHTAAELAALDAGSWFGATFQGEPVPRFAEVVAFCRESGIWMNVEIKPAPGFDAATGRAAAEVCKAMFAAEILACPGNDGLAPEPSLPLLSSFSFEALLAARVAAPELPRALLMDRIGADWQTRLEALGAVALHTNQKHLTPELARAVKRAGYGLFCYTVNDPARGREILAWGVDGFCTDRIDLIGAGFADVAVAVDGGGDGAV